MAETFNNPLKKQGFFSSVGSGIQSAQSAIAPFAGPLGLASMAAGLAGDFLQSKEDKKVREIGNRMDEEVKRGIRLSGIADEIGSRRQENIQRASSMRPFSSMARSLENTATLSR